MLATGTGNYFVSSNSSLHSLLQNGKSLCPVHFQVVLVKMRIVTFFDFLDLNDIEENEQ